MEEEGGRRRRRRRRSPTSPLHFFDAATVAIGAVKQQSNRGGVAIQTIFLFELAFGKEKEEKEKEKENQSSSPRPTWRTQNGAARDNPELALRSRRCTG